MFLRWEPSRDKDKDTMTYLLKAVVVEEAGRWMGKKTQKLTHPTATLIPPGAAEGKHQIVCCYANLM